MPGSESENKYRVFSPSHELMHPALFIIPVGGYSSVYSGKMDGMVAILWIFIRGNPQNLLHVLKGIWLRGFQSEDTKNIHFYNHHDSQHTACSHHNGVCTLSVRSCFCVSLKLRTVLRFVDLRRDL